jgi:hypothetical protein
LGLFLTLSVVGSAFALFGIDSSALAIVGAAIFLAALGLSIYMQVAKTEGVWYRARAVTESVKTATWRFVMCADPFSEDRSIEETKALLNKRIRSILGEHKELAGELGGVLAEQDQITPAMLEIRNQPLQKRAEIYREARIKEQRAWYAKNSDFNRRRATAWFVVFITLQAFAILALLLRIAMPEFRFWSPTVFAAGAGAVLTWTQAKRFRELAAVYGLTSHEIGLADADFRFRSAEELSRSVDDTENAFSREHTQWIARKSD